MRNNRNFIAALALALVLLTPALAGDGVMHTGVLAPSPTPTPQFLATTTDAPDAPDGKGIMHTGAVEPAPSATDNMIAEVASVLLQSVLILF